MVVAVVVVVLGVVVVVGLRQRVSRGLGPLTKLLTLKLAIAAKRFAGELGVTGTAAGDEPREPSNSMDGRHLTTPPARSSACRCAADPGAAEICIRAIDCIC